MIDYTDAIFEIPKTDCLSSRALKIKRALFLENV